MTVDDICQMTKRPSTLKALHACSTDKPLKWRKAWRAAQQDPDVNMKALAWLNDKSREEAGYKDVP